MTARIKQRFTDPTTKNIRYVDILIDLDERRMEDSNSILMEPVLLAYTSNKDGEDSVYLNPENYLVSLLDTRRTSSPPGCHRTYITNPYNNGIKLHVFNTEDAKLHIGDPIAILSDLNGTNVEYAIVKDINDNKTITINDALKHSYFFGAFVQNLSNRWNKNPLTKHHVGVLSKFRQPGKLNFTSKREHGMIQIIVHDVINKGTIVAYDVYVRQEQFNTLLPHWIPDVTDISPDNNYINLTTYGGGLIAGGNHITDNANYFVGVVSKDKMGRVDVNESAVTVEMVPALSN